MSLSQHKYSSKRFLTVFTISAILLLLCIGTISYFVDPFFQFRVNKDNHYFLNPRLVNGGLAKNSDYNTIILGSSMVQNYNLSILRENDPTCDPLKLSTGGMNNMELEYVYSFIKKDKVKSFIINLDLPQFNAVFEEIRYPRYLYDDGLLNKLEYLYGYETCIRFTPVNIGLSLYLKNKASIPTEYKAKTEIDNIGQNIEDYNAEHVKQLYLSGKTVSEQMQNGMKSRMQDRLNSMLLRIQPEKYPDAQYTFVLPPYSALYWHYTRELGYYNEFIDFVRYLNQKIGTYDNARIAFFFDVDEIIDLNQYSDITHFSPVLSDKILNNISNQDYWLDNSNIETKLQRMDSLVNIFTENNKDWITK